MDKDDVIDERSRRIVPASFDDPHETEAEKETAVANFKKNCPESHSMLLITASAITLVSGISD